MVVVDDEDYAYLSMYTWRLSCGATKQSPKGYPTAKVNGVKVTMHSLILKAPEGYLVDHKDRDVLNNRKSNLRIATPSQNAANVAPSIKSSSGLKGICLRKGRNKYDAQIKVCGTNIEVRGFVTEEDAAKAYDVAAAYLFGEFAWLNYPNANMDAYPDHVKSLYRKVVAIVESQKPT